MLTEQVIKPDAQRVARRAAVLAAVVCRSLSDNDPEHPDAIQLWHGLQEWIQSLDVDAEIEPGERQMIEAPLGTLTEQQRVPATWRAEGLAVLAWSLGLFPYPPHDQQVDPFEVTDALALLNPEAAEIITEAQLRPRSELDACREVQYAIHCRLCQFARKASPDDVRDWFEAEWLETLKIEDLLAADGDLRIDGRPLAETTEQQRQSAEWIALERHRATIWLVGDEGPVYSEVQVDT